MASSYNLSDKNKKKLDSSKTPQASVLALAIGDDIRRPCFFKKN